MNIFTKTYREIFAPALETMGFKRKRDVFHKLVNDKIVIVLSYKKYSSGHEFTIQFDFYPLCDGYDIEVFMDSNYTLDAIAPELNYECFCTFVNGECRKQLQESFELSKKYIFPYFERVTDYKSYYDFVNEVDHVEEDIRRNLYEIPNLSLRPYHYVLLAIGKYDMALAAQEASIKQFEYAMQSYAQRMGTDITEDPYYNEYIRKLEYYERIKKLISDKDYAAINKIILDNENYSRNSYFKNFFGEKASQ